MKKFSAPFFILIFFAACSVAQIPETFSASDILLRMKKLNVLGSVLYIAAHPDDENTRLLAWLSKEKLYRTGYLSLTRGDGGQNLIGDEQGIELGLIRTQELLAARQVDGADQFFSRAYDFGFSKTTAEALKLWNEQKILSDVVWIIRKFQPDIIITRFPEDKRAGHGQHSASSYLARLAYHAAADPKQFPEQFTYGVHPWQASRLFWNNYNFGSFNTTREDQLKIEVGGYNTLEGKSYGEIAADSRSQHRSQGFGVAHSRGNFLEYFTQTEGDKADSSLMQDINCSWNRIAGGAAIGRMIKKMIQQYDPTAPYKSLQTLVKIYKNLQNLPAGYWRDEKIKETLELIQACSGLWMEATVPEGYALQNQTIPVTLRVVNRTPVPMAMQALRINQQDTSWNQPLLPGINYSVTRLISLRDIPVSQPYWLVKPMSQGSYNVDDQMLIGRPWNPPAPEAIFSVQIGGEMFTLKKQIFFKYTDPVKGEIYEPLTIVPFQMAYCNPDLLVCTRNREQQLTVRKQIKTSKTSSFTGLPVTISSIPGFETRKISDTGNVLDYILKAETGNDLNASSYVTLGINGKTDTLQQCRTINYEYIPRIDYFKPAAATVVSVNLQTRGTRIGYVEGAGDKVPDALTAMGYTVVKITENNCTPAELSKLDAVITGVRAYDVHDWLRASHVSLMEYVKSGGNLIVQYNRNQGGDSTLIGPYPFGISNIRVTEEDAPVKFLHAENSMLHFPNEITENDFSGWIQERGIYFATHIDSRYQTVFSMHDSGEPEQEGSLITGVYGSGHFTYTGLVFFRELPAGVPGAYRLLANLIALNQQKDK